MNKDKIQEAAENCYEEAFHFNSRFDSGEDEGNEPLFEEGDIKDAFMRGVEWFKQSLWHDEEEIPSGICGRGQHLLLYYEDKEQDMFGYSVINLATDFLNFDDFDRKEQWEDFLENAEAHFKWCYLKDLFPKKGGRQ